MDLFGIFLTVAVIVVIIFFSWYFAAKRRKELLAWATAHGLAFSPRPRRLHGLPVPGVQLPAVRRQPLRVQRHAPASGRTTSFVGFDYHYETYSTDSKGGRQTHHHYFLRRDPLQPRPAQAAVHPAGGFLRQGHRVLRVRRHRFRVRRVQPEVLREVAGQEMGLRRDPPAHDGVHARDAALQPAVRRERGDRLARLHVQDPGLRAGRGTDQGDPRPPAGVRGQAADGPQS